MNAIAIEVFMLPLLEVLNLSNNKLTKLPVVPPHHYRPHPLFVCDISSNRLIRFYEFLLMIAKNIDLSSNKIRTVPSRLIDRLTLHQLESKLLKLEENPLINPPIDICKQGLKCLKEWFEEEAKKIQLNKGFKILLFGDAQSGKTTLTYALEDFNTQSNLIEQSESTIDQLESKFIEVRDFYMKNEPIDSDEEEEMSRPNTVRTVSRNVEISESTPLPRKRSSRISAFRSGSNSASSFSNSFKQQRPKTATTTINAFSNIHLTDEKEVKKESKTSRLPVHIYDFNGSINQFTHLMHLFMDKTALIMVCVDASKINLLEQDAETEQKEQANWKQYLKELIDLVILKMNKTTTFYLIPVLTKSDKILKLSSKLNEENLLFNKQIIQTATSKVEQVITSHINSRLQDIRDELKKIESLTQITASHSDRLKQLVQIQANLQPQIHQQWHVVSSLKMDSIGLLSKDIQNLVTNDMKFFPTVNEKVPTFWIEVEKYACNTMSQMYASKAIVNKSLANMKMMSMLCIDFEYFKDVIIEKYGMSHLIDAITKYMSSSGKIIWFQDTEKTRQKVFLRPSLLCDLLFVLFRSKFSENFADNYSRNNKQSKYTFNLSDELIAKYSTDLLASGILNLDLLKFIWYPILSVESSDLVQNCFVLISNYFSIGYPELPKDKLKALYNYKVEDDVVNEPKPTFTQMILPFYLPKLDDSTKFDKIRGDLKDTCRKAIANAVKLKLKHEVPKLLSKLSQKYTLPWGLKSGIFERFSNILLLSTELHFKTHLKNFLEAYNDDSSIG